MEGNDSINHEAITETNRAPIYIVNYNQDKVIQMNIHVK